MNLSVKLKAFAISILIICTAVLITKTSYADYENTEPFNIAPNPSFEEGTSQPSNWTSINGKSCNNTNTANGQTIWISDQALSGSKSVAI